MHGPTMIALGAALLAGCAPAGAPEPPAPAAPASAPQAMTPVAASPAARFFAALEPHCGKAYAGRVVSSDPADADFAAAPLVMHVAACSSAVIHIPFHVGDDRSRTWVLRRVGDDRLQLKHDHRHEDGSPDAVTMYGGISTAPGTPGRQEFPVDGESVALFQREGLDASVTNVWALELGPRRFAYELRRPSGRFFRAEFDLTRPLAPPPPPWGWEAD
ncbi:hypothetical protein [Sphingomicrobium astaxanthinifaciens]|uniref:hypothetical protein n=1 Tax=Sphingomicrobium astaxanthinifaciens TaxID=1227949 RepID=UPI001FCBF275|nr:hypothetical protein [Sphingomicrobium astaxanthinifaciens]MCJ7421257.1 hypothetical protein [Sphingomicrobium astaxanthinifaciens]